MAMWPDSPPNAAKCWPSDVLRAGSRRPWGLNRKSPRQIFRRFPRAPVGGLLVAVRAVSSLLFRFLRAICTWRNSGRRRAVSFGGPSLRSSPAATRRRRPEGTAVSRFEDALWAVRAARSSRTAVPCPPAAAKYRQLLMHAVSLRKRLLSLHDCSSPAPAGTITVAVSAGTAIERLRYSAETRAAAASSGTRRRR